MKDWIKFFFEHEGLTQKGHCQRNEDLNLGMGWLYYALVRLIRPKRVVVIGSWRGFSPLVFGKGIEDNIEDGEVLFIDPSMVDDFWIDNVRVGEYFNELGVDCIRHYLMTTQQFVETEKYRSLDCVNLLFVDGYHSEEQAQFDYEAFEHLIPPTGAALFHDSIEQKTTPIYGHDRVYRREIGRAHV